MESDLLRQGFELMLVGMATVFLFLTTLVLSTMAMSGAVARWFPEAEAASPGGAPGASAPTPQALAAVAGAVAHHRARRAGGGRQRDTGSDGQPP